MTVEGRAGLMERLCEVPAAPAPRPAFNARKIQQLEAEIEDKRGEIEWLEDDIAGLEARIDRLREGEHEWPDKWTLLALYGAPGNWPVEAAA